MRQALASPAINTIAALVIMVAVIATGPASAQTAITSPGALGLNVMDVRIFGKWAHNNQQGYFRGIIARDKPAAGALRFVLQWIAVADDKSLTLIKSMAPPELAKDGVNVIDYRHEMDADGLALFIDTVHPRTNADTTYEMFVFTPNEYEINPASN
jgi:hypothetical protein